MQEEIVQIIKGKGSGSSGHLLNSTLTDEPKLISLNLGFTVDQISISSIFTLALTKERQIYIWGFLKQSQVERPLRLMENVEKISCGWEHALFTANNQVYGFGSNSYNQLGIQTTSPWQKQAIVISKEKAFFILAGFRQSYVVFQKQLWGCGESKKYQLAKVSKTPSFWGKMADISNVEGQIISIQSAKRFLLLLSSSFIVYALGFNESNCFRRQKEFFIEPTRVFENVKEIACGWSHIILLITDGMVESYGKNNLGQLGHRNESVQVEFDLKEGEIIEHIYSGTEFSFARSNQGRLFGWGWNQHQNITNLQTSIIPTPTEIQLTGKCLNLWTHSATTFIETDQ